MYSVILFPLHTNCSVYENVDIRSQDGMGRVSRPMPQKAFCLSQNGYGHYMDERIAIHIPPALWVVDANAFNPPNSLKHSFLWGGDITN